MTTIHKNSEMDKWYAIMVLVFILVLVYFLFFQSFVTDHSLLNEEMTDLDQSRQDYTELVSLVPELQKRIRTVKETVGDNTNFLVADTYNLGTAELTRLLKTIVSQNTDSSAKCQTVSNTPSKDREPDKFEKIILKVRMRCQFDKMVGVLQDIEKSTPNLFIDNLQMEQRAVRRSRKKITKKKPMQEIRFDLYAYMNKPVRISKKDSRGMK